MVQKGTYNIGTGSDMGAQGLAQMYGGGEGQNTTHYYAGVEKGEKKMKKKKCKKGSKSKGK